jgi:hypothetical protein
VFSENRPVSGVSLSQLDPEIQAQIYELQALKRQGYSLQDVSARNMKPSASGRSLAQPDTSANQFTTRPETPRSGPVKKKFGKGKAFAYGDEGAIPVTIQLLGVSILGGLISTATLVMGYAVTKSLSRQRRQHQLPSTSSSISSYDQPPSSSSSFPSTASGYQPLTPQYSAPKL